MFSFEKLLIVLTNRLNWIAAVSIVAMMLLTTADVILRYFRHPVPGTYEIVGLLGAVVISFSLAYTSVEKGHIAVDFLVQKFSEKVQAMITAVTTFFSSILFALITWQSIRLAFDLKHAGEVSMTLQMPVYPFVFGIAIGCGLLFLVLLNDFLKSLNRILAK